MKMISIKSIRRAGYTLVEVVIAGAVIAVGMTGAASLSSSMMAQEELSWRVSVARNYQENLVRLWQLGLSASEVLNLIPSASGNPKLSEVIGAAPSLTTTGQSNVAGMGVMESAVCSFTINTANVAGAGAGGTNQVTVYRPTLK
jgi:type II secretory pathway pseudopilin PulG